MLQLSYHRLLDLWCLYLETDNSAAYHVLHWLREFSAELMEIVRRFYALCERYAGQVKVKHTLGKQLLGVRASGPLC